MLIVRSLESHCGLALPWYPDTLKVTESSAVLVHECALRDKLLYMAILGSKWQDKQLVYRLSAQLNL